MNTDPDISGPLLRVKNLSVKARHKNRQFYAVNDASFQIQGNQRFGLFGPSGSGKTLTALSLTGLLPPNLQIESGTVELQQQKIIRDGIFIAPQIRGKQITYIFQDAKASLHPLFTIGSQFRDILKTHTPVSDSAVKKTIAKLLEDVGLNQTQNIMRAYPHQLSGGMAQRVAIAAALACSPKLIIADEPTTALDRKNKELILDLLLEKQAQHGFSILFITHEIQILKNYLDDFVEIREGKIQKNLSATVSNIIN